MFLGEQYMQMPVVKDTCGCEFSVRPTKASLHNKGDSFVLQE